MKSLVNYATLVLVLSATLISVAALNIAYRVKADSNTINSTGVTAQSGEENLAEKCAQMMSKADKENLDTYSQKLNECMAALKKQNISNEQSSTN